MNLTKPQKMIYDMVKISGDTIAVNCSSMLITGKKCEEELQTAVNELFRLNDTLRLRINKTEGQVSQYVTDFSKQNFEVLHFTDKAELNNYADVYSKEPIDLTDPLCDFKIVILPEEFGLLVKLHHIISDAWTFGLLFTQFNTLINKGKVCAFSYFDYCETEKTYINSKRYIKDRDFFLEQIRKCENLSFFSEKKTTNLNAERKVFIVKPNDAEKIKRFAEKNNCSVFSVFSLALAAYISRIKMNAERFFIGTTILNRNNEKELNTAGIFINTVPMLFEVDGDKSFQDNLEGAEDSLMSVFRHQRYNYNDLLIDLGKEDNSYEKLYDVMINYMNAAIDFTDETIHSTWHHNGVQNESLQIHIDDRDNEGIFKMHYDYQTEKFTEREIELLHNHLMNLIFEGIENENKKLHELDMLTPCEKQKLIYDFNNTAKTYSIPDSSTIYSLFEKTAKENKSKTCITTADKALAFGELLNLSEALDGKIRSITNNKKSIVAVICERSAEMYASIYGIIRGGNAYLPISPDYPKERIEYILKNSSAALVIAQDKFTHLAGDVPCVDMTDFVENKPAAKENLPCAALPGDTAYVIYTSGSTGNSKGAKVSHKSAVNRILWMQDAYPIESDSVILQKTPYTFDVSVWEIFWWGMCGGSLAVSKPGEHFLPAKILDEAHNSRVTHLHFVPSVFDLFLTYLEAHKEECFRFNSVKHVFLSGEALTASLIKRFYALYDFHAVKLHNLYGPTECAVDVTYYDCTPDDSDPVPIGRPIYNTAMYVTDKHMNILPAGVKGELCIGGANVGQGYLNNEELTAEKFIDNPYGDGKMYKTGDVACWREDGQLIFCGRTDGQIKLGGQRIEIGEIEAVIGNIPDVETAAVIVRKINGHATPVAFYCGKKNSEEAIKSACVSRLPKYMVPTVICHIEKMPLNQSGKLDRKALSAMEVELDVTSDFEAPLGKDEEYICNAFSKALNVESIGRHSDFFVSGGSSLSMITLLSDDAFSVLTAADFIESPTPAKLAELIKNKRKTQLKYLEPLWTPEKTEKAIVLFPFAGGGAEAYTNLVNSIKAANSRISLYFVRYLHTKDECEEAAAEISSVLGGTDIYFYSHCVGSAVAMSILSFLEKDGSYIVKHYIAGASIPPKRPGKKNLWNIVPDKVLKSILIRAGAPLNALSDKKVHKMLKSFRTDTDFSTERFYETNNTIECAVSVVINKEDLFTLNYKQAEKIWKKYAQEVRGVYFIDSATHYFQSDNSNELAHIIMSITE